MHDGARPKVDIAHALEPGSGIPEASLIEHKRREIFRARAERLTLREARERILAESDEEEEGEESWGMEECDFDDELSLSHAPLTPPFDPTPANPTTVHGAWIFNPPPIEAEAGGKASGRDGPEWKQATSLLADAGPNEPRALRNAHLWLPSASDLQSAWQPFVSESHRQSVARNAESEMQGQSDAKSGAERGGGPGEGGGSRRESVAPRLVSQSALWAVAQGSPPPLQPPPQA